MELGFLLLLLPIATFSLPRSESEQGESSQLSDIQAHWLTNVSMEINFPNDTTYTILLSPSTNIPGVSTPCLFSGQLQLDQRSVVAVTGCLDSNETTMSIASRLMPGGLLDLVIVNGSTYLVNGSTFIIEDDASFRGRRQIREDAWNDYLDPPPNPNPVSALFESYSYLPESVSVHTSMMYDNTLLKLFGGSHQATKDWINEVVLEAKPLLKHHTLKIAIHLKVTGEVEYLNEDLRADDPTLKRLINSRKYRKNTSFFCADHRSTSNFKGWAFPRSYCSKSGTSINISCTNLTKDIKNTARIFVHELGHNIGMKHDFHVVHGGNGNYGGPCDKQGLMSYGNLPDQWSTCSNKDFISWYNSKDNTCM